MPASGTGRTREWSGPYGAGLRWSGSPPYIMVKDSFASEWRPMPPLASESAVPEVLRPAITEAAAAALADHLGLEEKGVVS